MYFTNFAEDKILRVFLNTTLNAPRKLFAAPFLSNPGEEGGGTEISYTGYGRKQVNFSEPTETMDGATMTLVSDVSFPKTEADAGNITHFGLMDSEVGGNMWAYVTLDEPINAGAGTAPLLQARSWNYHCTGNASKSYAKKLLNVLRGIDMQGFIPYFALYNGNPDAGGSELTGGNYARFTTSFSTPEEQSNGQMMIKTSEKVSSNRATESWGNYTHTAICDASSSGEVVTFKARETSRIMGKGHAVIIEPGDYAITLT